MRFIKTSIQKIQLLKSDSTVQTKSCMSWVCTQMGLRGLSQASGALFPQSNQEFTRQSPCPSAHPKSAHTVSVYTPVFLWQGASMSCCVCRAQHCPKERYELGSWSCVYMLVGNSRCARSSWFTAGFINSGAASHCHVTSTQAPEQFSMPFCTATWKPTHGHPWGQIPKLCGLTGLQGSLGWVMRVPPLVP